MLAQAEGVEAQDIAKILPTDEYLVDRINGADDGEKAGVDDVQGDSDDQQGDSDDQKGDVDDVDGHDDDGKDDRGGDPASAVQVPGVEDEVNMAQESGLPTHDQGFAVDAPEPTGTNETAIMQSENDDPERIAPDVEEARVADIPSVDVPAHQQDDHVAQDKPDVVEDANNFHTATVPPPASPSPKVSDPPMENAHHSAASPPRDSFDSAGSDHISDEPTAPPDQKVLVPFPAMPRMNTSVSTHSNLSELDSGAASDTPEPASTEEKNKDKRRKRLSSIKGFVRRISDQGVSRGPALRPGSSGKGSMEEVDETAAMSPNANGSATPSGEDKGKMKKRLSIRR